MATITGTLGNDDGERTLFGTAGNDTISGFQGDDRLVGEAGDDLLFGGLGDDILIGGPGDDTLRGGDDGDPALRGGPGNDIIDGGAGFDEVEYVSDPSGITLDLRSGIATDGYGDQDQILNIEAVIGSDFDDVLLGDANMTLFNGGPGNDTIDGRGGRDALSYIDAQVAVRVDLLAGTAEDGWGGTDTIRNFWLIAGSDFDDRLAGDNAENRLIGGLGNDTLLGNGGDDDLWGDEGRDTLDGGAGKDAANYRFHGETGGVTVNLAAGRSVDDEGVVDRLISIEDVVGSTFDDKIIGDDKANFLQGFEGNDRLFGEAGKDVLWGGDGNDILFGGDGNDTLALSFGKDKINGGAGRDRLMIGQEVAVADSADQRVTVNLKKGKIENEATSRVSNVEDVLGTFDANDEERSVTFALNLNGSDGKNKLVGGAEDDVISGAKGNDVLEGAAGRDLLNGGQGRDKLTGGEGKDVFVFTGNWGRDTITDFELGGSDEQIQIAGEVESFKAFKAAARQKGDHVIYDAGRDGENVIVIENTELSAMKGNDLAFV